MGLDAMILVFLMFSFKSTFSLSSFILIKRFFSSSSLSTIRLVSSANLRLLVFLPAILIPACDASSLAFCTMYSAYTLTVVLEKTLEIPLDSKIKPVNPKGNQPWIFIGKTDTEAPILWPPDAKYWFIGKDPDAEKDWRQEEKGMVEGEMVGWHHWLNGHESEQTLGDSEGKGSLGCCSPWGRKESDMTEQLNNNKVSLTNKCSRKQGFYDPTLINIMLNRVSVVFSLFLIAHLPICFLFIHSSNINWCLLALHVRPNSRFCGRRHK